MTQVALVTAVARNGDVLTLTCSGTADATSLDRLDQQLADVHRAAVTMPTSEVLVDLRSLEFASSSCIKSFATWLHLIQQQGDQRYRVRFRSNPRFSWQRRSLGALATFAPEIVEVDTGAA
jgi:hypothetical protein